MSPVSVSYYSSNNFNCPHSTDKETEAQALRGLVQREGWAPTEVGRQQSPGVNGGRASPNRILSMHAYVQ